MGRQNGFTAPAVIIAIIIILIIAIAAAWAFMLKGNQPENGALMEDANGAVMKNQNQMINDAAGETTMRDETTPPDDGNIKDETPASDAMMMEKSGAYKNYSAEAVAAEQNAGNKVVLFFHAAWCPFCKAADNAFIARVAEIPDKVTILKTDYDMNTALKQKYGVTYQHTFVQIDNDGNEVSQWNGGDIDNLITYLK